MTNIFKKNENTPIEVLSRQLMQHMSDQEVGDEEWTKSLVKLERIHRLKLDETQRERVSPDTVVQTAGMLLAVLIMVGYEHGHVITSKATMFIKGVR